jgi:HEAT repeat protein
MLPHIRSDDVVPALLKAVKDKDAFVRAEALRAAMQVRSKELFPVLTASLQDPDGAVRLEAVRALHSLAPKDPTVVPALVQLLKQEKLSLSSNRL